MAALRQDEKEQVRKETRKRLKNGPMHMHVLVNGIVKALGFDRRAVTLVVLSITHIVEGGEHDGKRKLDP
jgi:hypothetical protein